MPDAGLAEGNDREDAGYQKKALHFPRNKNLSFDVLEKTSNLHRVL